MGTLLQPVHKPRRPMASPGNFSDSTALTSHSYLASQEQRWEPAIRNSGKDLWVVPATAGLARMLPLQSSSCSGGKQSSFSILTHVCTDL